MTGASSPAIEILVLFDRTVLLAAYLGPGRCCQRVLRVGEPERRRLPDLVCDTATPGQRQVELARWEEGQLHLDLPPAALAGGAAFLQEMPWAILPLGMIPGIISRADGGARVPLPAGAEVTFPLGPLRFLIRPVPAPAPLHRPSPLATLGSEEGKSTLLSLLGHAMLLLLIFSVPRERSRDTFRSDGPWPGRRATSGPVVSRVAPPPSPVLVSDPPTATEAEGPAGPPQRQQAAQLPRARRHPSTRATAARPPLDIREVGILGLLRAESSTLAGGSTVGSIFAPESALGERTQSALGQLQGHLTGAAAGHGGLGLEGSGPGGGCLARGTCSEVRLRSIGRRGGSGSGRAGGIGGLGDRTAGSPSVVSGSAYARCGRRRRTDGTVQVPCGSKELIRRVIRRHVNEVKYCYERALMDHPRLHGRVSLRLLIGPQGRVVQSGISSSTLGHAVAEQCIATAGARWGFPALGGTVEVTYPFLFHAAGPR